MRMNLAARHRGGLLALALLAAACGSGDGGDGSIGVAEAPTTTEESTTTTTERPPTLRSASTASYVRSDGIEWTATLLAGDVDESPSSIPRQCSGFAAGRDAIVPIQLRTRSNNRARTFARVVLTDRGGGAASFPTGDLQRDLELRSDQRILLDVTDSPEGPSCIDLTRVGYNKHPEFGIAGSDQLMELNGQLVLIGYRNANGIADENFRGALNFRWVHTFGPSPAYQINEGGRNFTMKIRYASSNRRIGQSDSTIFALLP